MSLPSFDQLPEPPHILKLEDVLSQISIVGDDLKEMRMLLRLCARYIPTNPINSTQHDRAIINRVIPCMNNKTIIEKSSDIEVLSILVHVIKDYLESQ